MKNKCPVCNEPIRKQGAVMCANCLDAKIIIQRSVSAMMTLHGIPMASGICVDCGARPATARDHRHYASPLKVDYVCGPCNFRRGPALDLYEMIKRHRGLLKHEAEKMDEPQAKESKVDQPGAGIELPMDIERFLETVEKHYIEKALEKTRFNITKAAGLLSLSFRSMRYRIEKHGIKTDSQD